MTVRIVDVGRHIVVAGLASSDKRACDQSAGKGGPRAAFVRHITEGAHDLQDRGERVSSGAPARAVERSARLPHRRHRLGDRAGQHLALSRCGLHQRRRCLHRPLRHRAAGGRAADPLPRLRPGAPFPRLPAGGLPTPVHQARVVGMVPGLHLLRHHDLLRGGCGLVSALHFLLRQHRLGRRCRGLLPALHRRGPARGESRVLPGDHHGRGPPPAVRMGLRSGGDRLGSQWGRGEGQQDLPAAAGSHVRRAGGARPHAPGGGRGAQCSVHAQMVRPAGLPGVDGGLRADLLLAVSGLRHHAHLRLLPPTAPLQPRGNRPGGRLRQLLLRAVRRHRRLRDPRLHGAHAARGSAR